MEYKYEKLTDKIYVCASSDHRFGTDAFLLADFSQYRAKDKVCDLGTGCGIIPMLLVRSGCGRHITGIDIQENACLQAKESVILSKAEDKVSIVHGDIKNIKNIFEHASFDTVIMNPPYKSDGDGIKSREKSAQIARHETMCNIDDVCKAASYLLNFSGKLCLCGRPERLVDTITSMRAAGIEPKRLRFVSKFSNTKPWLFLIEGKKGGKPFMNVESVLAIYSSEGVFSDEMLSIYGEYKENHR